MTQMYDDYKVKPRWFDQELYTQTTMKKDKLFPDTFVAFPTFLTMLDFLFGKLNEERDSREDWEILFPWNNLNENNRKVKEKREKEETFNLYVTLLELLVEYVKNTIPERNKKLDDLESRRNRLSKKNNYKDTPTTLKIQTERQLVLEATPTVSWFEESWGTIYISDVGSLENWYVLEDILLWILMKCKVSSLDSVSHKIQILPLDNFDAWSPMFTKHHMTNQFLCQCTLYGHNLLEDKKLIRGTIVDEDHDDSCAEEFECFFEGRTIRNWMEWLKIWGYTYESAREFFGVRGFLSNLYNQKYIGIEDEKMFDNYVNKIILPQFDEVWNPEKEE